MDCDLNTFREYVIEIICEREDAQCKVNEKGEFILKVDGQLWVMVNAENT